MASLQKTMSGVPQVVMAEGSVIPVPLVEAAVSMLLAIPADILERVAAAMDRASVDAELLEYPPAQYGARVLRDFMSGRPVDAEQFVVVCNAVAHVVAPTFGKECGACHG